MTTIDDLAKRTRHIIETTARDLEIPAIIVSVAQGSTQSFRVYDTDGNAIPRLVWFRLLGGTQGEEHIAVNTAVEAREGLPIYVREAYNGGFEVIRLRGKAAANQYGEAAGSFGSPDKIGELSNFVLAGRNFAPGRMRPVSTSAYLTMFVEPFWYDYAGQPRRWPGGQIDLSGNLPSTSNYWQWVWVALDPEAGTLTAVEGTEYAAFTLLTDEDLATLSLDGLIPVDAVRLQNGMTQSTILPNEYLFHGRPTAFTPQWVQADSTTTTDNTQTTALSLAVAEDEGLMLNAQVTALRDDWSEMYWGTLSAGARRVTSGNVTLVGMPVVVSDNDSSGTPALTADVDTGTQTLRVRVTGETSKTFVWTVRYLALRA